MRLKLLLPISCFLLIANLAIFSADAKTESLSVPPETDLTKSLHLKENDRVSIGFSVIGEISNQIDFYITNPDEDRTYQYDNTGHKSFSFLTTKAGTYTLHFDNTQSTETKIVTLNCDVEHYILGMPEEMFLVIVVAVVCVLAIAVFILAGKPKY